MLRFRKHIIVVVIIVLALTSPLFAGTEKVCAADVEIQFLNLNNNTVINKGTRFQIKLKTNHKIKDNTIRFLSSDDRIATVSKKGVIFAKKKGSVWITAYVEGIVPIQKTVKITIGKEIRSIRLSGYKYLKTGRITQIDAVIQPKSATNTRLKWSSNHPEIVSVNQEGIIEALSEGTATITAGAVDGSGVKKRFQIIVFALDQNETKWIAHRGMITLATENTAEAFSLAGQNGFWGCECDVWETKHALPDEAVYAEESFDIVINHDDSFNRVWNVNEMVKSLTVEEIRNKEGLSEVCFLQEFLDICYQSGMIPVVEIKDGSMSDEGKRRVVDMIYDTVNIREGKEAAEEWLSESFLISAHAQVLADIRDHAVQKYDVEPVTELLIGKHTNYTGDTSDLAVAVQYGFSGVGLNRVRLTKEYSDYCRDNGLLLSLWTYPDDISEDRHLYEDIRNKDYNIFSFTTNGRLFQ